MNITKAIEAAISADTFAPGMGERTLAQLPKTDVLVQRDLLRHARNRIEALERALRKLIPLAQHGEHPEGDSREVIEARITLGEDS